VTGYPCWLCAIATTLAHNGDILMHTSWLSWFQCAYCLLPHTPVTETLFNFIRNNLPNYLIQFLAPGQFLGPPLNVKVTAESSSSLSVTWKPPEKDKRNGMIVNYTVCISHEECKPCFEKHTTEEKMLVIDNLNVSTKYYVRVLASTKVGSGNYSKSKGKFTNESKCRLFLRRNE
jgi:hypothetical protein